VSKSVGTSELEKGCFLRADEKGEDSLKHRKKEGGYERKRKIK
jgi:hypothetical protein